MEKERENLEKMPEEYGKLLKSYKKSDDEIGEKFQKIIDARLEEIAAVRKRRAKFIAFSRAVSAVAAVFAVVFFIFLFAPEKSESGEKISESVVAAGDPVTINLVYDAAEDLENVRFFIKLDDGISFLSSDEKIRETRSHEWTGSLKKGKNSFPFVVKTEKNGRMEILTTAEYSNYSHKHKIVLDAQKNETKVSMFIFAPSPLN